MLGEAELAPVRSHPALPLLQLSLCVATTGWTYPSPLVSVKPFAAEGSPREKREKRLLEIQTHLSIWQVLTGAFEMFPLTFKSQLVFSGLCWDTVLLPFGCFSLNDSLRRTG